MIGEDPFGAVLDGILVGETIDGKAVVAKRVATPQEALDCRVLFISSSEDSRLKEILGPLEKAGVLTQWHPQYLASWRDDRIHYGKQ